MENTQRTELSDSLGLHSDLFKDLHGFRPRGMVDGWIQEDFDTAIERLSALLAEERLTDAARLTLVVDDRAWLTLE